VLHLQVVQPVGEAEHVVRQQNDAALHHHLRAVLCIGSEGPLDANEAECGDTAHN